MKGRFGKVLSLSALWLAAPPAVAEAVQGGRVPGAYFDWTYLATIAGATAATLLIVQYTKAGIDKVLKFPTRLYVYIVALAIVLCAQAFTSGLSLSDVPLLLLNALVVSTAVYGSYELTFAKLDEDI